MTFTTQSAVAGLRWYVRLASLRRPRREGPVRRLLVTSTGGVGDGILVASLIHYLRAGQPGLEIGVLAKFGAEAALRTVPNVRLHNTDCDGVRDLRWWKMARQLYAADYDAALATDHVALSIAALLVLAAIPRRIGFEPLCASSQGRLYTEPIKLDESDSQWTSLLRLARAINPDLSPLAEVLPLPVSRHAAETITRWWSETVPNGARPVIALHLGVGVHYFKRWPIPRFVELAERIRTIAPKVVFLLTGSVAERARIAEFAQAYRGPTVDCSGLGALDETGALLRRCDLLVSNDCGIMHLGAAIGTPTVGLFGPASIRQWAPLGLRAIAVAAPDVPCSPCIQHYRGLHPAHCTNAVASRCMWEIGVDEVITAARQVCGVWLA